MAPTICLPELSMQQKSAPNSYRRYRQRSTAGSNNGITKDQERRSGAKRSTLNKTENFLLMDSLSPPASPTWEPSFPRSSAHLSDHWRSILARREGLLDIVARTMVLVRRNQMLQKRVNALRSETHDFIRSVLSNPENNGKQERAKAWERGDCIEQTMQVVSSSSESFFSEPTPPPTPDSSTECEMLQGEEEEEANEKEAEAEAEAEAAEMKKEKEEENDYCEIGEAPSFSYSVDSPLSIESFIESDPESDYSYDYPDSPGCRLTQDPKVSSS